MKVTCDSLKTGALNARGLTVVIDVFRAFTCAPLLFSFGIKHSVLAATPKDALALKEKDPNLILIGEVGGAPIEGFDFGNSPSQLLSQNPAIFQGKIVVQRTSSGVQGALAALENADEVLLGSFALSKSIAAYIKTKNPDRVSIVAMGWDLKEIAPEDEWCARYIAHLVGQGEYDHRKALKEIVFNKHAQKFLHRKKPYFPPEDPVLCLQRDMYDFVLKAERKEGQVIVTKQEL
jgi:2-phosphosulfolactate phosphatase